ncbi:MAG: hypothetical protein WC824_09810 [Bacteroidota bacterium]|jgi:hypothetical protein
MIDSSFPDPGAELEDLVMLHVFGRTSHPHFSAYPLDPEFGCSVLGWLIEHMPLNAGLTLFFEKGLDDPKWYGYIRWKMGVPKVSIGMHGMTPDHVYCLLALRLVGAPVDLSKYEDDDNPSPDDLKELLSKSPVKDYV